MRLSSFPAFKLFSQLLFLNLLFPQTSDSPVERPRDKEGGPPVEGARGNNGKGSAGEIGIFAILIGDLFPIYAYFADESSRIDSKKS